MFTQKYTQNIELPIYREVSDFYESFNPQDVPVECQKLKQYVIEGHSWYAKNVGKHRELEYTAMISFVEELRTMFEKTIVFENYSLTVYNDNLGIKVNISPLIEYINWKGLEEIKTNFLILQDFMVTLLHDSNIQEFKQCNIFVREFTTTLFNL